MLVAMRQRRTGYTVAIDTLVGSKLTVPIGTVEPTDKSSYQKPPWAEAGSVAISRPKPGVTILQWLRHAVHNVRSRTLEQDKTTFAGFTCKACPNPRRSYRRNDWTGQETSYASRLLRTTEFLEVLNPQFSI